MAKPKLTAEEKQAQLEAELDAAIKEGGLDLDDIEALLRDKGVVFGVEDNQPVVYEATDGGEFDFDQDLNTERPVEAKGKLTDILERCEGDRVRAKGLANWLLRKRQDAIASWREDVGVYALAVGPFLETHDRFLRRSREKTKRKLAWVDYLLENFCRAIYRETEENILPLPAGKLRLRPLGDKRGWNTEKALAFALLPENAALVDTLAPRAISQSELLKLVEPRKDKDGHTEGYYLKGTNTKVDWVFDSPPPTSFEFRVEGTGQEFDEDLQKKK